MTFTPPDGTVPVASDLTPEVQAFYDQWIQSVRDRIDVVASPAKLPIVEALAVAADAIAAGNQLAALQSLRTAFDAVVYLEVAGPTLRTDDLSALLNGADLSEKVTMSAQDDLGRGAAEVLGEVKLTEGSQSTLSGPDELRAKAISAAEMRQRVQDGVQPTTLYGVPRGCNLLGMSREEFILSDALRAVESVGASPTLTDVTMLLDWARDTLGRWIDRGEDGVRSQYVEMITDHDPGTAPPDEQATEAEIIACGAHKFPRVSSDQLTALVESVSYLHIPGTSMTIAVLKTVDGFLSVGSSASASIENFNPKLGRELACRSAREKLWQLEGYALRKRLSESANFLAANPELAAHIAPEDRSDNSKSEGFSAVNARLDVHPLSVPESVEGYVEVPAQVVVVADDAVATAHPAAVAHPNTATRG